MSKYDWSKTPPHVNYKATDQNGFELWFSQEPYIKYDVMWLDDTENFCLAMHSPSDFKGDWRNSLEQRPDEVRS